MKNVLISSIAGIICTGVCAAENVVPTEDDVAAEVDSTAEAAEVSEPEAPEESEAPEEAAPEVSRPRSFEDYRHILECEMFGPLPANFDVTKMSNQVEAESRQKDDPEKEKVKEQIKKAIRFSAMNREADGTVKVAFSDSADPKNPLNYYMAVGEKQGGWTVVEADCEAAVMTITNDEGVSVTLRLGGDSATDAKSVVAAEAQPEEAPRTGRFNARSLRRQRDLRNQQQQQQAEADREAEKARLEREAADRKRRDEETARREAEHEEQRKQLTLQLQQIQEEFRKEREAREAERKDEAGAAGEDAP